MANFDILGTLDWSTYADTLGGTITATSATELTYRSANGFVVTLSGAGFAFDGAGLPTAGTISEIEISRKGEVCGQYSGLDVSLATYVTFGLGLTSGSEPTDLRANALMALLRQGDDVLNGNDLGKSLQGLAGDDTIYGNGGADWLDGGRGTDDLYGGKGADTVWFSLPAQAVRVNLGTGLVAEDGFGTQDHLSGIENAAGTRYDDTLGGSEGDNRLLGYRGDDRLLGQEGGDTLFGGEDDDRAAGGEGDDLLFGGSGLDTLSGDTGADTLYGEGDSDLILAGDDGDRVYAGFGNDTLFGGAGNDTLSGSEGSDVLSGGDGDDYLFGGTGRDSLYGGAGDDTLIVSFGTEQIVRGGLGADWFVFDPMDKGNATHIADFETGVDTLQIPREWFTDMSSGTPEPWIFLAGDGVTEATTPAHRFIYDTATGDLYIDIDGSDTGSDPLLVLHFDNRPALAVTDIFVPVPF